TRMRNAKAVVLMMACGSASLSLAESEVNLPKRKSGLWQITIHARGAPMPMVTEQCVGEETDDLLKQQGARAAAQADCDKNSVERDGDRIVIDSVCRFDKTTATTHAVYTGDFSSGYSAEMSVSYDPPMAGMKEAKQTIEAKLLGPCKPGQKPGDVSVPGMGTMNLEEMMKNMPKPPPGQ
ncbi:MAG: DUF3617 domain-containing protein, partial [Gammaproteobacteria bacterium]